MCIMACNFTIQNLHFLNAQVSDYPLIPTFPRFNLISSHAVLSRFRASIRCSLSINKSVSSIEHSLEVSYLIDTFGWSLEYANLQAKSLKFETIEQPEKVLEFLKNNGFLDTQISKIVMKYPLLLLSDPENTLSPKITFLRSLGLSGSEITRVVTRVPGVLTNCFENPERVVDFLKEHGFAKTQILHLVKERPPLLLRNYEIVLRPKFCFLSSLGLSKTEVTAVVTRAPQILCTSLRKRIIPAFNLLRSFLKSADKAVKMVKRHPMLLIHNLEEDNIKILQEVGVPDENIVASMMLKRRGCIPTSDMYRKMVQEVIKMGFDPSSLKFLTALWAVRSVSKSDWEDRVQVLKKYGWSNTEVAMAFNKNPRFIRRSKYKIEGIMDFLVNRMSVEATAIANWPVIFTLSLEKRIVPRCLVYQFVLEKELCKKKRPIYVLCNLPEDQFITKVIKPYENEAPELWDLYKKLIDAGNDKQI